MYVNISVPKPNSNAGVGGAKKDKVTFIDLDDVQVFPNRDAKGIVIEDNIIFKPGKYAISVYGTVKTMAGTISTEGDPDNRGFMPQFVFSHPGSSVEIREFAQNWNNKNVAVIVEKCGENSKTLYGGSCSPMQIMLSATDNDSENKMEFTIQSQSKTTALPADYRGTITYEEPLAIIAANEDEPSVALGSGQYQTSSNTAATAITTLAGAVHNGVYTLLGSGGSNPSTIAAGGVFLLKDGVAWSAISGSQITFRAFKDGANTFKFVELSRV